ncbi:MAG TPA: hypothetical protein VGN18_02230 [Jatrophihabitans sp.]|jgi:hypothetical protein|uniref:hypothetical protein n=1 Tax=Jatrophihabitans sp. TaxID=1932789 RepID=UPI002DFCF04F|nr:hypothetical protein [Jatrophihabitans sp.]
MAADEGDPDDRPDPAAAGPDTPGDNAEAADAAGPAHAAPGGRHAAPEPADEPVPEPAVEPAPELPAAAAGGTSRRGVLLGAAAVVLAGGGGVGAGFLEKRRRAPIRPLPPAALTAAADDERQLIADLDATTGGSAGVRVVIAQARADHAAHLRALEALLGSYRQPVTPTSSPSGLGTARTAAQLRSAETQAAVASGRRAAAATGSLATLFASIAACESTHAALLT